MGTCTSTARRRQKQQQHNQTVLKNSIVLGIKPPPPLPPLPSTAFPNRQTQQRHPLFIDIDLLSPQLTKSIFHQTDTNSLIQLYSSNRNNNNNNSNTLNWMSSSSSVTHVPPRIPVPKSRLPVHHSSQQPPSIVSIRPKNVTSIVIPNNQTGKNIALCIFIGPIFLSLLHICLCYQYHSHLVRIIETSLYDVSYFFFFSPVLSKC